MKLNRMEKFKRAKQQKQREKDLKKAKLNAEKKMCPTALTEEREWNRKAHIRYKKKKVGNTSRRAQQRAKKGLQKIA